MNPCNLSKMGSVGHSAHIVFAVKKSTIENSWKWKKHLERELIRVFQSLGFYHAYIPKKKQKCILSPPAWPDRYAIKHSWARQTDQTDYPRYHVLPKRAAAYQDSGFIVVGIELSAHIDLRCHAQVAHTVLIYWLKKSLLRYERNLASISLGRSPKSPNN